MSIWPCVWTVHVPSKPSSVPSQLAAIDNIDHNPSSTTATDALHGTLFQHPINQGDGCEHREHHILAQKSTIKKLSELHQTTKQRNLTTGVNKRFPSSSSGTLLLAPSLDVYQVTLDGKFLPVCGPALHNLHHGSSSWTIPIMWDGCQSTYETWSIWARPTHRLLVSSTKATSQFARQDGYFHPWP